MNKILWILLVLLAACATSNANDTLPLEQRIIGAIKIGRYADAIALVEYSDYSSAEKDFSIGELVLQGWSDDKAQQPPVETVEMGIGLLERSAIAGHRQAISGLAGLFYTGLRNDASGQMWVAANKVLQDCWEAAKDSPRQAKSCIALRRKN
jgi:hypothetical protein